MGKRLDLARETKWATNRTALLYALLAIKVSFLPVTGTVTFNGNDHKVDRTAGNNPKPKSF